MDIWLVAAAAGAGCLTKLCQKLPSREKEGLDLLASISEKDSPSESRNLLQQIWERTCPIRRLIRKQRDVGFRSHRNDVADTSSSEMNRLDSYAAAVADCNTERDGMQKFASTGINEYGDSSGDFRAIVEMGPVGRFKRRRHLRSRSCGYSVKSVSSLESCLAAQLSREHPEMEEYVCDSISLPPETAVRPLLVTDGCRIIGRADNDFSGAKQTQNGIFDVQERTFSEATEMTVKAPEYKGTGLLENSRKPGKSVRKGKSGRFSKTITGGIGDPLCLQGQRDGTFHLLLGFTLGTMCADAANKREMDRLSNLLKQTENLVQDLHEQFEMKHSCTMEMLENEGFKSCSEDGEEADKSRNHDMEESSGRKAEMSGAMSKIEAELEAEIEKLELNMKKSSLEIIDDYVEMDPYFVAVVVQGDLKPDRIYGHSGTISRSTQDSCGTSFVLPHSVNYAVCPVELSLRLHEVIESRLNARIIQLETALENSQKSAQFVKIERAPSGDLYSEMEPSSSRRSPVSIDEGHDSERSSMMNLSAEALAAYSEPLKDVTLVSTKNERILDQISYTNDTHAKKDPSDVFGLSADVKPWFLHSVASSGEEHGSASWGSNEVGESEDEEEDDEMERLLIMQIVEKTRQGSPLVLNAQRILYSLDH